MLTSSRSHSQNRSINRQKKYEEGKMYVMQWYLFCLCLPLILFKLPTHYFFNYTHSLAHVCTCEYVSLCGSLLSERWAVVRQPNSGFWPKLVFVHYSLFFYGFIFLRPSIIRNQLLRLSQHWAFWDINEKQNGRQNNRFWQILLWRLVFVPE